MTRPCTNNSDLVLVALEVVERRAARPPVPHLDEIVVAAADEELLLLSAPVHARHPSLVRRELAPHDHALLRAGIVESGKSKGSRITRPIIRYANINV